MSTVDHLQRDIRNINDAWVSGEVERLEQWFDPDIVIAAPGSSNRVAGRAACIESYRQFVTQAAIHAFELSDPWIDVVGDTAVAICPFVIDYTIGGNRSVEAGRDVLVFSRRDERWLVVWRTLLVDNSEMRPAEPSSSEQES